MKQADHVTRLAVLAAISRGMSFAYTARVAACHVDLVRQIAEDAGWPDVAAVNGEWKALRDGTRRKQLPANAVILEPVRRPKADAPATGLRGLLKRHGVDVEGKTITVVGQPLQVNPSVVLPAETFDEIAEALDAPARDDGSCGPAEPEVIKGFRLPEDDAEDRAEARQTGWDEADYHDAARDAREWLNEHAGRDGSADPAPTRPDDEQPLPGYPADYVDGRDQIPGEDGYGSGTRRPGIYRKPDPALVDPPALAEPGPMPAPNRPEPKHGQVPCEVCGVGVLRSYVERTGRQRHGHHPKDES